jgi:hypothetical protein
MEKEKENQKNYWYSLYDRIPEQPVIPGARNANALDVEGESYPLVENPSFLSGAALNRLNNIARRHSVSLFIVLQAAFNQYLSQLTGKTMITFAMQSFGRDILEGAEDQIGLYARMNLVTSIFKGDDAFDEVLVKVKKANEDMQRCTSFSLLDAFQSMVPPEEHKLGNFCRFILEYNDSNGYYTTNYSSDLLSKLSFSIETIQNKDRTQFINTDMKLFFFNLKEAVDFKVLYNGDRYDRQAILDFIHGYADRLENL